MIKSRSNLKLLKFLATTYKTLFKVGAILVVNIVDFDQAIFLADNHVRSWKSRNGMTVYGSDC